MIALRVENLCKTYNKGPQALKNVTLEVDTGDFFALLGPNGAGKSTLIGIVSSLVTKSAGRVEVFGFDMDHHQAEAKACIGVVPQEFNFNLWEPPLDVVVNQAGYYGIPRSQAIERAEYYLRKLSLWEKRAAPSRQLSGGMKRRLMIARALVHEPRLLILDEPTAGVDIEIRRSMWSFLSELNAAGTTIILTTHYLEEAESLCENIAIINGGELIENTDMKSLLATLHVETSVLELRDAIEQAPQIQGFPTRMLDAKTLEVDVYKEHAVSTMFHALSVQGIEVVSIRNKANRLEELFMHLIEEDSTLAAHKAVQQ